MNADAVARGAVVNRRDVHPAGGGDRLAADEQSAAGFVVIHATHEEGACSHFSRILQKSRPFWPYLAPSAFLNAHPRSPAPARPARSRTHAAPRAAPSHPLARTPSCDMLASDARTWASEGRRSPRRHARHRRETRPPRKIDLNASARSSGTPIQPKRFIQQPPPRSRRTASVPQCASRANRPPQAHQPGSPPTPGRHRFPAPGPRTPAPGTRTPEPGTPGFAPRLAPPHRAGDMGGACPNQPAVPTQHPREPTPSPPVRRLAEPGGWLHATPGTTAANVKA